VAVVLVVMLLVSLVVLMMAVVEAAEMLVVVVHLEMELMELPLLDLVVEVDQEMNQVGKVAEVVLVLL
tara:strand:+ start:455 stop:658 length:204 start_codon:yes stop_codon:yes gene_type:complete